MTNDEMRNQLFQSNDIQWIRRHPDVQLLELRLQLLLKLHEELTVLRYIRHIDEDSHQVIAKDLRLMLPLPLNRLRFARDRSESFSQFNQCVCDQFSANRRPVIQSQRKQHLEPPERLVHTLRVLRREMGYLPLLKTAMPFQVQEVHRISKL